MLDPNGNLVTSFESLEKHTIEHYKKVLANRPMKDSLQELQKDKEELCNERV